MNTAQPGDTSRQRFGEPVQFGEAMPRTVGELRDTTRCPACFTPLASITCRRCGLDLTHASAGELAMLSSQTAILLERRGELIARMRLEGAARTVMQPAPAAAAPASAPAPSAAAAAAAAVPVAVPVAASATPPTRASEAAPAASVREGRRSGVQVALLVTGISLLSVFAIFFMVYAFINYGLIWRSVIIASLTIAAIATATLLRRRRLVVSGEAIAVFALILLYLDAFALRANGFFGLDAVDGRAYWGWVLVGSALTFIGWYRVSGVRAASIVGYAVAAPGVGILVSTLVDRAPFATAGYVVALSMAIAGAVQHTATLRRRDAEPARAAIPERVLVTVTSAPALLIAAASGVGLTAEPIVVGLAVLGCAAVAGVLLTLHLRSSTVPYHRVMAGISGVAAGGLFALAAVAFGVRATDAGTGTGTELPLALIAAPTLAAVVILAIIRRSNRNARPAGSAAALPLTLAAGTGTLIAVFTVLPATAVAVIRDVTGHLVGALQVRTPDADIHPLVVADRFDALAVHCLAVLAALVLLRIERLHRHRWAIAATTTAAALVLLTVPPLFSAQWIAIIGWTVVGLGGVTLLLVKRGALTIAAGTAAIGGIGFAWVAGWGSDVTWPVTSAILIVAALAGRHTTRSLWARCLLVGVAAAAALIAVAAAAEQLGSTDTIAPATFAAAGVIAVLSAIPRPLATAERQTALWVALVTAAGAGLATINAWNLGGVTAMPLPIAAIAGGAALTGALVLWARVTEQGTRTTRLAATGLLAPAAAYTTSALAVALAPDTQAPWIAAAVAGALVAGAGLLITVRTTAPSRTALDFGAIVALLPSLGAAFTGRLGDGWLALALAAIATAVIATSADGLTGSHSRRRHLGWLALALATLALWWALAREAVEHPEPYVLPPAAALIAIALLLLRRPRREGHPHSVVPMWLIFFALLLTLVPLAVAATGDSTAELARAIATLAASILLLLGASLGATHRATGKAASAATPATPATGPQRARVRQIAIAVGAAGAIGTLLITWVRAIDERTSDGAVLELWLAPGTLALVASALILGRAARETDSTHSPAAGSTDARIAVTGPWLLRLALVTATVAELAAVLAQPGDDRSLTRLTAIVGVLAAIHVGAALRQRAPLDATTSWIAIGLAALAATAGAAGGTLDRVEQVTAPIALALIAGGALALHRAPAARSWPHLAPGLILLLVPSLIATYSDAPPWRLVLLGAVGVLVIIAGTLLRLQAPFVIGIVVVLIHALRTFAPQLRIVYEAADWYIWAGVGGAIVTIIAVRYEQRLRDARRIASSIASLR